MRLPRHLLALVLAMGTLWAGLSVAAQAAPPPGGYAKLSDFAGATIAQQTGTMFAELIAPVIPDVNTIYLESHTDVLLSVSSGKADAASLDMPVALLAVAMDPTFVTFPESVVDDNYGFAVKKGNPLTPRLSAALEELRAEGALEEAAAIWLGGDDSKKILFDPFTVPGYDGSAGVLRYASDASCEPMAYMNGEGELVGYDLDVIMRIAAKLNYKAEFTLATFSALIPAVSFGKFDMVGCCMSITEERKESVDFVGPYYNGGIVLVVRADALAPALAKPVSASEEPAQALGFWASLARSFERTFIVESRWKLIVQGLGVTLLISLGSALLGTALGFGICLMRRSQHWALRTPAAAFIRIVQGVPIVVILMILFYVVFGKATIDALWVAIFGFSINFGVYVSEMMRSGIDAVDKGQIEAAAAIGFSRVQTFTLITLPQAARHFLPVYKGEFISMVKMTSVAGYIAINDLTKMSDIIRSRTYEAFFPLIATALIYFAVAYSLTLLLSYLEFRIDPKQRKRIVKGVQSR